VEKWAAENSKYDLLHDNLFKFSKVNQVGEKYTKQIFMKKLIVLGDEFGR
jgi:hypothetical protein